MLNFLLAIIVDAFSSVKSTAEASPSVTAEVASLYKRPGAALPSTGEAPPFRSEAGLAAAMAAIATESVRKSYLLRSTPGSIPRRFRRMR